MLMRSALFRCGLLISLLGTSASIHSAAAGLIQFREDSPLTSEMRLMIERELSVRCRLVTAAVEITTEKDLFSWVTVFEGGDRVDELQPLGGGLTVRSATTPEFRVLSVDSSPGLCH